MSDTAMQWPDADGVEVVMVAMEGPDPWSQVGGLGTRVTGLTQALAARGVLTHLVFWGDPQAPAEEQRGPLELVRWNPALNRRWPEGVYAGEAERVADWERHLPEFLIERWIAPAVAMGREVVVLAEEWQTANLLIALSDRLHALGLRPQVTLVWNANNLYGFDRLDWRRLQFVAHLTTVSRFMKQKVAEWGGQAVVIPNGIAASAWTAPPAALVAALKAARGEDLLLAKVARYDPDKRWPMALEALQRLRRHRHRARILVRGHRAPYREVVRAAAKALGLEWETIEWASGELAGALAATTAAVVELGQRLADDELKALYGVADAVLAQSGMEPFGLVGLEVMAQGGVAVTGGTGEDYAVPYVNALVVDTDQAEELEGHLEALACDPELGRRLRANGPPTARSYAWDTVIDGFWRRLRQFRRAPK
ncbi:MAG: glycosyltransferase family 4 protein [Firmicutes bacterium]|nr:glycosyltransferase family 4 protein [Alicyclobacillaceae bacterium]MCL6497346.1 glycosyltransferase family 4 protein [Bacillota bacterium]